MEAHMIVANDHTLLIKSKRGVDGSLAKTLMRYVFHVLGCISQLCRKVSLLMVSKAVIKLAKMDQCSR